MKTNSAINLYAALGVYLSYFKVGRNKSYTKKGPGRQHDYETRAEKEATS